MDPPRELCASLFVYVVIYYVHNRVRRTGGEESYSGQRKTKEAEPGERADPAPRAPTVKLRE